MITFEITCASFVAVDPQLAEGYESTVCTQRATNNSKSIEDTEKLKFVVKKKYIHHLQNVDVICILKALCLISTDHIKETWGSHTSGIDIV